MIEITVHRPIYFDTIYNSVLHLWDFIYLFIIIVALVIALSLLIVDYLTLHRYVN